MQDAIDIMYKLQTGIDVNVKFSGKVLNSFIYLSIKCFVGGIGVQ